MMITVLDAMNQDDASVSAWIPSAGIDYDVIYEDISLYLGAGSTVERENHPVS
jgi:hypothetical protein